MIFDQTTISPCIIQPPQPPDARCVEADYALQHPTCASALVLKPDTAMLCHLDSVVFSLFEFAGGVETELTSGVSFTSSDPTVFAIGVLSGSGTAIGSGDVIITAAYGNRSVQATINVQAVNQCCDEVTVATAIVVDNSNSMSLSFGGDYAKRLVFAKAAASGYGGLISEVNGVPKDSVEVWSANSTLTQLLASSQDTTTILAAIAGIVQTQQKTDLLAVFTVAAQGLLASGADKQVLLLLSDCEVTIGSRQPILDAAFAFKAAGGIVIVIAPRASGVMGGFDLAERLATPGFFINANAANAANTLAQLNYLKKLLCAGSCVDPGERYENQPALGYSFEPGSNWEVVDGIVNLLGPGLMDFLPGNGLYVELAGQAHAVIGTIDSFDILAGHKYLIHFKAAGNQQSLSAAQSISASLRIGPTNTFASNTKVFEQTVFPAWNADFGTYDFTFTALYDAAARLYFEQNYAGTEVPGSLIDDVLFKDETTSTPILADNFDGENLVYILPACGPSSAVEAIDDPEAPTVEWLNDAGDNLNHIGQFTYGITYVTNEGETAVTTVLYQNIERFAFSETVRRLNLPTSVPANVTSVRIWRSLGEGDAGAEPQNNTLFLFTEVSRETTALLDDEDAAAFTARHEPSVEAPTVNTTGISEGGLGYGYAPCCYYYTNDTANLILPGDSDSNSSVVVTASTLNGASTDGYNAVDGDINTSWSGVTGNTVSAVWTCAFPTSKLISSYQITAQTIAVSAPTVWILEGSNNGSFWTEIDSQSVVAESFDHLVARSFNVSPEASYRFFRFTFDDESASVKIAKFQLVGAESFFIDNCTDCLAEVPGRQIADSPGLVDIESGTNPTPSYTCVRAVDVGCPVGFANAPTANIVPVMTSATAPIGTVISSAGAAVGYEAWRVFDGDAATYMDLVGVIAGYVGYHNTVTKIATSYKLTARSDYTLSAPKAWTFEGSNNGSAWTVLDTRANISWFAGQIQTFAFTNAASFTYYRLNVTSNVSGDISSNLSLARLEIFGAGAATAHGEATGTGSTPDAACANATAEATKIAVDQLTCVPVWTATRLHTRTCPFGTLGSITLPGTGTSFNSEIEARALAQAAAEAATLAYFAAHPEVCSGSNNLNGITILDNANANPYPSVSFISASAVITKVVVNINGLTHASPDDLRILLVSPEGTAVWLMKNCGGVNALNNANLVFDDTGAALPDAAQITSGTYAPTIFGGNQYPPPPAPPQSPDPLPSLTLAAFIGEDKQGAWQLYVSDDLVFAMGSIATWSLTIS